MKEGSSRRGQSWIGKTNGYSGNWIGVSENDKYLKMGNNLNFVFLFKISFLQKLSAIFHKINIKWVLRTIKISYLDVSQFPLSFFLSGRGALLIWFLKEQQFGRMAKSVEGFLSNWNFARIGKPWRTWRTWENLETKH